MLRRFSRQVVSGSPTLGDFAEELRRSANLPVFPSKAILPDRPASRVKGSKALDVRTVELTCDIKHAGSRCNCPDSQKLFVCLQKDNDVCSVNSCMKVDYPLELTAINLKPIDVGINV